MTTEAWSGGCQCGAVRFTAEPDLENGHLCHCRMCQKAVGAPFAAHVGAPVESLIWTRGEPSEFESSAGIFRGFCKACGTYLYFRREAGKRQSMAMAAFDRAADIPLNAELGIESRWPALAPLPIEQVTSEEENPEGLDAIRESNKQHPDHDT
ncbi:GFA family protein [Oceaniradius stylonematis]|uniref:GFA family protein n=1 Tax=Oceaniradius stylonematis TaxID=2184161 RepID=UPI0032047918